MKIASSIQNNLKSLREQDLEEKKRDFKEEAKQGEELKKNAFYDDDINDIDIAP